MGDEFEKVVASAKNLKSLRNNCSELKFDISNSLKTLDQ